MFESLINPRKAERKPWELFLIGLIYASLSMLFVKWIFSNNPVFAKYSSILLITFTVMFSIPFMYYTIKLEEEKDIRIRKEKILIKEHGKALAAFMYLFLGVLVAFSFWYIVLPQDITAENFQIQIEQYCAINAPTGFEKCVAQQGVITGKAVGLTAGATSSWKHVSSIFLNNIYVLIFCLVFSFAFGAGVIFILIWNASVIATAIGIFTKAEIAHMHIGIVRYMIHGIPEILAYFIAALAGGIISVAIIRHDFKEERFWHVLQDSLDLILLAIVILFIAAIIEVFVTPALF